MPEILENVSLRVEERWWDSWCWHSSKRVLHLATSDAIDGPCGMAVCVGRRSSKLGQVLGLISYRMPA